MTKYLDFSGAKVKILSDTGLDLKAKNLKTHALMHVIDYSLHIAVVMSELHLGA